MKYYLSLLMAAFFLAACSGENKKEGDDEGSVETVLPDMVNEVSVMTIKYTDFHHELISNGRLSARKYVDLRFESAEPISSIYVKNGDRVTKGQKLAELYPFKLSTQLAQARTNLAQAKLELQDYLIGQGYAIQDSAKVPEATMQLVRIRSGYDTALSTYELAAYEERNAILKAPFDGVVANLFAKELNVASTSDVFCTIIDPQSLEASFTVLESELGLIRVGDRVVVTPFAIPEGKTEGRISEINPIVDENGMVQIKATVNYNSRLFEGMNVRVSVQRSVGKQLVVPKQAVVLRSGKQVIFTLDKDNKAYWNYVQTGLENASQYTVVDGLEDGATVITSGNINLAHEAPVVVVENQLTMDN